MPRPAPTGRETLAGAFDGRRLQLVTGVAPGADRRAIARWRQAALGPIHALTPFLDPASGTALTDDPKAAKLEDRVGDLDAFETWTCLDPRAHDRHGHAELSRWIVRHCEVLAVVWDGGPAAGPGGTADAVRLGLAKGVPILWIAPNRGEVLLLDPCHVWADDGALERTADPHSFAGPATVETLVAALELRYRPPTSRAVAAAAAAGGHHHGLDKEMLARRHFEEGDPPNQRFLNALLERNLWRTFDWFKKSLGGTYKAGPAPEPTALDADAQRGFDMIAAQFELADEWANALSAAHRSEQLLLLAVAFVAVAVGAFPAPSDQPGLHLALIFVEILLGGLAWGVWTSGQRQHRHRLWSDDRRLAERLRAGMVTFPLGFDVADHRPEPPQTWTEWWARAVIRAAGVPGGVLTKEVFNGRLRWAAGEIIGSQARYHRKEAVVVERLTHKLHLTENGLFFALVVALFCAFGSACRLLSIPLMPPSAPPTPTQERLELLIRSVTFLSAVVPAAGAAIFAVESTNGFSDIVDRSAQYALSFEELSRQMETDGYSSGARGLEIIRSAAALLVSDADSWREQLVRRRLIRGG